MKHFTDSNLSLCACYHYPICDQIDLYGEARYNVSFNRFEKAYAGYHDAYGLTLGVCYRL
jgi:hypothetical protein